ncbi:MAG: TIGR04282 family arsenosugar biosynthesis glycosyltransferase [Nitrospinae bacterium]|nr:TIGR04282 family arsenosugar biosynthesis glycosyltransferase [Nitrospinota bacterium]
MDNPLGGSRRACVLMAKVPIPGQVKTRLLPLLDEESSARLYACFLRDMVEAVEAAFPGLCRVAYTPAGEGERLRGLLPEGCPLIPQRGAHLGERLYNIFHFLLLSEGLEFALAVNSDSPTLPMGLVADAFARLEEPGVDVVLGPADDGGYYLIGLTKPQKHLFDDIPWSTPEVLPTTLKRAAEARLRPALLEPWYDVDDREDLRRLCNELEEVGSDGLAPTTWACLKQFRAEGRLEAL